MVDFSLRTTGGRKLEVVWTKGQFDGVSFAPLLGDPRRAWKRGAFAVVGRSKMAGKGGNNEKLDVNYLGRTVRTERWRYTEWPNGAAELYDQDNDPREHVNLAAKTEHAATRAELKELLRAGWKQALPPAPAPAAAPT